jgi:outer membrane lipoprotein-sorting protein
MKTPENDKWLDDALIKAIGSEKVKPNFTQWKKDHPEAVKMLTSRTGPDEFISSKSVPNIWRTIMNSKITKLAAAVVIVIAVTIGIIVGGSSGSGVAFAEVLEYIQASGYTFDLTVVTGIPDSQTSTPIAIRAAVLEPGKMRLDASLGVGEISSIVDIKKGESLLLFHRNKAGMLMKNPVPNQNTGAEGIFVLCTKSIENLWSLRDGNEKNLGEKEIEGLLAEGFQVSSWDQYFNYDFVIWANPETAEPLLVEITATPMEGSSESLTWTMSNINLDVELDESLFSTSVPQGYTQAWQKDLKEIEGRTESSTGANQVIEVLSLWVEGKKDQALQALMKIDWDEPIKFPGDAYLFTMTEQQCISLKPDDQQNVMKEVLAASSDIRQISREVVNRAQQAISNRDNAQAERYLQSGLQLGNLLNHDPDAMLVARLVGIAIQRHVLPEMINLYQITDEPHKLQEAQEQLKAAEAEVEQIKRNLRGN